MDREVPLASRVRRDYLADSRAISPMDGPHAVQARPESQAAPLERAVMILRRYRLVGFGRIGNRRSAHRGSGYVVPLGMRHPIRCRAFRLARGDFEARDAPRRTADDGLNNTRRIDCKSQW